MQTIYQKLAAFAGKITPAFAASSPESKSQIIAAGDKAPRALVRRPSREDVIHVWRHILGRDPPEDMIDSNMRLPNIAAVRLSLIRSPEFRDAVVLEHFEQNEHPDNDRWRPTVVYIHLMKTGGTSLRITFGEHFAPDRICPMHFNRLHDMSVAELGRYDFFNGHFDFSSIRFIHLNLLLILQLE